MVEPQDKETVTPQPTTIVPAQSNSPMGIAEILRRLRSGDSALLVSDEMIQQRMDQRLLNARNLDELLGEQKLIAADDIVDVPFRAHGMHFNNSEFADGPGVYAVIEATIDGEFQSISCGSVPVIARLAVMMDRGWLPADVMITKASKPTKAGYTPKTLIAAPKPEEQF